MSKDYKEQYRKYRPRYLKYRRDNSDRYNAEWNKAHREARKILESDPTKDPEICYNCGVKRKTRCHHVDGDGLNNEPDNLQWCCYSCDSKQNARKYVNEKNYSMAISFFFKTSFRSSGPLY